MGYDVKGIPSYRNKGKRPMGITDESYSTRWTVTDTDGKIAIPFSFHANFPVDVETLVTEHMLRVNDDLGCIKTIHIPKESILDGDVNPWRNGILFVWTDVSSGCWSAMGKADGYTGNSVPMSQYGAPDNWQFISLDPSCGGSTQATVEHELFHAFGFGHEHSRPDRDQYLNVNLDNAGSPSSFYLIENWVDSGTDYPFELESGTVKHNFYNY